jgi:hypothetical protein
MQLPECSCIRVPVPNKSLINWPLNVVLVHGQFPIAIAEF